MDEGADAYVLNVERDQQRLRSRHLHLLSHTGLRRGEALARRWRDVVVDWKNDQADRGHLSISRAVGVVKEKGQPERIVEDATKTGVARSVALDPETIRLLRRWRLARTELSLASGRPNRLVNPEALVFGTIDGEYRHPERFSRLFTEKVGQCRHLPGRRPAAADPAPRSAPLAWLAAVPRRSPTEGHRGALGP